VGPARKISKWFQCEANARTVVGRGHGLHSRERNDFVSDSGLPEQVEVTKVLVIDDSNTIRRSAEIFLKQGGYQVVLAEDGFDALSKVNDHDPDIIFCDILMPRLDGYQTCAIIKRNPKFASTPVIMLSSKDGLFDKARGRMVGSQDYLTKPFTKDQLLQAVATFTSGQPEGSQ
jgi:twitching motility two-component system response regulator PilG